MWDKMFAKILEIFKYSARFIYLFHFYAHIDKLMFIIIVITVIPTYAQISCRKFVLNHSFFIKFNIIFPLLIFHMLVLL
jgi:hypothetical protein